jgi:hypothetical protein
VHWGGKAQPSGLPRCSTAGGPSSTGPHSKALSSAASHALLDVKLASQLQQGHPSALLPRSVALLADMPLYQALPTVLCVVLPLLLMLLLALSAAADAVTAAVAQLRRRRIRGSGLAEGLPLSKRRQALAARLRELSAAKEGVGTMSELKEALTRADALAMSNDGSVRAARTKLQSLLRVRSRCRARPRGNLRPPCPQFEIQSPKQPSTSRAPLAATLPAPLQPDHVSENASSPPLSRQSTVDMCEASVISEVEGAPSACSVEWLLEQGAGDNLSSDALSKLEEDFLEEGVGLPPLLPSPPPAPPAPKSSLPPPPPPPQPQASSQPRKCQRSPEVSPVHTPMSAFSFSAATPLNPESSLAAIVVGSPPTGGWQPPQHAQTPATTGAQNPTGLMTGVYPLTNRAAWFLPSPVVFLDAHGRPKPPPPPPPRSLSATYALLHRSSSLYGTLPRANSLATGVSVDTLLQQSLPVKRGLRFGGPAPRLQPFPLASPFGDEHAHPSYEGLSGMCGGATLALAPHTQSPSQRMKCSSKSCAIDVPQAKVPSLRRAEGSGGSVLGSYSMWLDKGNIWQCAPEVSDSPC